MKRVYWRPNRVSALELVLVALIAVAGLVSVERLLVREKQAAYEAKIAAAKIAKRAFEQIHIERIRLQVPIDPELDPAMTGVIGLPMSPIVSNSGVHEAKLTSVNPNFAAVIVDMLDEAEVQPGSPVAIGLSGSFPALNACVYAAMEAMHLKPVVITSVAASQFGASIPELTWLDMERVLYEQGIIHFRSVAASRGGINDRGDGHTEDGRRLLEEAIARNHIPLLDPSSYQEAVAMRMEVYRSAATDERYAAYINVGGGTASVGTHKGKKKFNPGLNLRPPRTLEKDSVMRMFANQGTPVLHMSSIVRLAERYGLPVASDSVPAAGEGEGEEESELRYRTPDPGQGAVYYRMEYNLWLVWGVLLAILAALYATVRMDIGFRVLKGGGGGASTPKPPEQMV